MSTAHRISDALQVHPMGDLEKYFEFLSNMIEMNSGTNDYKMVTHDSYALSVPVPENQTTKFRITDSAMDIVDISQGYIVLTCEMTLNFSTKDRPETKLDGSSVEEYPGFKDLVYFFVGFKSGAHIIDSYTVYSNGRATACKQTKATSEQTIVFNCKAKEERNGRPGMYSVHSDVLKMRDCVCGVYIEQQDLGIMTGTNTNGKVVKFDVVIQVDDLLPFSAMAAYPRFKCGELELEIKANLRNNMVFCQVPIEEVLRHRPIPKIETSVLQFENDVYNAGINDINTPANWTMGNYKIDSRFHQCGDYARCLLGFKPKSGTAAPNDCYVTIEPKDLVIKDAKSYVHGFNIKEDAKDAISEIIDRNEGLMIPAQWIDQTTFAQLPANTRLAMNTIVSLFECGQVIITFPNSANQLTVSRNPGLKSVKCQIGDKMIPSKNMSTFDRSHAEMCLTALGMDSLFTAPKSLINAYCANGSMNRTNDKNDGRKLFDNYHWRLKREDDSDYMFVCDLERNGSGTYADGITAINCAISFDGEMENGNNNNHYYEFNPTKDAYPENKTSIPSYNLKQYAPLLFTVSDAYWIFNEYGGEFIKDQTTTAIRRKINEKAFAQANRLGGIANPDSHFNPNNFDDDENTLNPLYNRNR